MLHEAKDRQKFVSDVQYLRDIQHKVDSEYQECLRQKNSRKDSNEKKQDQIEEQETNMEKSWLSSGSSSKQDSGEEDSLTETPPVAKCSLENCDSPKLPAIDQTAVKQKHKSTMTSRKSESVEAKTPSPDSIVQQEGPLWAGDTKLKRPPQERRNIGPYSQNMAMAESNLKRGKRWDPSIFSHDRLHPPQAQPFQATRNPWGLSEALGPPLLTASLDTARRKPFGFRDKDFYTEMALNPGGDGLDTDEETRTEEELLSASMYPASSPSHQRRSRFLTASAALTKNKIFEENPANWRPNPFRSEFSHGSLGVSTAGEPMTALPSPGQRPFCDPLLPNRSTSKENDRGDREHDKRTPHSWVTRSGCSLDFDGLRAGPQSREAVPLEEWPSSRDRLGIWQADLNHSSSSLDYFLLGPRAPRSSLNPTYHTPRSLIPSALSHIPPVDLSTISAHRSRSEANSRFNMRQPLCPIRNRNLLANIENQSSSESHSAQEQDVRREDNATLSSQPQETPCHPRNPPCHFRSVEPTTWPARMSLQDHLPIPDSLQENIPFTTFAVSEFPGQSGQENRATVSGMGEEKGAPEIKANPEKLKKLQESLLEEDEEEEGDLCRICQIPGGSPTNPLLEPCACVGSLQFVHQECLKRWLKVKITSGADLHSVKTCEMCKKGLIIDLADFNMTEFFQKHQQFRTQSQLMNSGLYLVLLLHLYEQRFAALMRLSSNLVTIERLSRNYSQPRPEESENSEVGDESGLQSPSNRRVI